MTRPPAGRPVAVLVARAGDLPLGAYETVAEAGGTAVVVGSGAERAAALTCGEVVLWCDTGPGLRVGALSVALAPVLADSPLVLLPSSPDGRDLAPRLAAALGRPLLAQSVQVGYGGPAHAVRARLARLEDRVLVDARCQAPAVATLVPGTRSVQPAPHATAPVHLPLELPAGGEVPDVEVLELVEPAPETMELAEARRVVGGGAGLVPSGKDDRLARDTFALLGRVAGALGASTGATRVAIDAGWVGYDRQIGTTGVVLDPDLYIAFGVSGAAQHTGGLGAPRHVVSVNTDPSCPMTAMADLGLVTDAYGLLLELAGRLGIDAEEARRG